MIPAIAVRRVAIAGTAPASKGSSAAVTVASWAMQQQQRRMSSSKPSSPDGSKSVSEMHTSTSSRSASGKTGSEKRKRRAKDALDRDDSFRHLPCVPSTHHMTQEGVFLVFVIASLKNLYANHKQPSACRPFSRSIAPSPLPTACPRRFPTRPLPPSSRPRRGPPRCRR